MSKDTPEVGDVWESINQKIVIIVRDEDMFGCAVTNSQNKIQWRHKGSFCEYTYLGKSKANIDDLFKTENEE